MSHIYIYTCMCRERERGLLFRSPHPYHHSHSCIYNMYSMCFSVFQSLVVASKWNWDMGLMFNFLLYPFLSSSNTNCQDLMSSPFLHSSWVISRSFTILHQLYHFDLITCISRFLSGHVWCFNSHIDGRILYILICCFKTPMVSVKSMFIIPKSWISA